MNKKNVRKSKALSPALRKALKHREPYTQTQLPVVNKFIKKLQEKPFDVRYEMKDGKVANSSEDFVKQGVALFEATGCLGVSLTHTIETQLLNVVGDPKETGLTAAIQFLSSQKPNDEVEGLILTQAYTAHLLAMKFAKRAAHLEDPDMIDRNANSAVRMMKTFTNHIEALNRYRGKGQQMVRVEHVTVNDGGQAVIAPIIQKTIEGGG